MVATSIDKFYAADAGPSLARKGRHALAGGGGRLRNRAFLDHEVSEFQPSGDVIYLLGFDKRLWRLHAGGKTRDPVDEAAAAFEAVDASVGSCWDRMERCGGKRETFIVDQGRTADFRIRLCRRR